MPIDAADCTRLARRAGPSPDRVDRPLRQRGDLRRTHHRPAGRARTKSSAATPLQGRELDPYSAAVVEATEAVLNSLFMAPTAHGRSGNVSEAIPVNRVLSLLN